MRLISFIYRLAACVLFFVCSTTPVFTQNNKQQELENQRIELRKEIENINALRIQNQTKEKSELSLIEDFNYKIKVLENLIKVTNQESNLLTQKINQNQSKISDLRDELKDLRDAYAKTIKNAYKSKNKQSRLMFLLASDNFTQAYKRIQYMKQYANYQKAQGEAIKEKTKELQSINLKLSDQQDQKKKLIAENSKTQQSVENERKQHHEVMQSIRKKLHVYNEQIIAKQKEADRIDNEIERVIKEAIAKSNIKAGKPKSTTSFSLTKEEKVLSNSFALNRGKLPWPVEKGYVKLGYGTQPHPLDKKLTIKSNGVRISTTPNAKIKAVFNGEVIAIVTMKNVNPIVIIKHGDYITAYKNLGKVFVKSGDIVKTKQVIGEVFTNPTNGESILSFSISKDSHTENPETWIYKM